MTADEIAEAVVVNMEARADLLAQSLASTDEAERAQLRLQIQATLTRADELATLQGLLSAVATLRAPPPKVVVDPELVSNLQERAALLEQSRSAADKTARDQLQAQIQLNAAKADDLAKLRSVQDELDRAAKAAAAADAIADVIDVKL